MKDWTDKELDALVERLHRQSGPTVVMGQQIRWLANPDGPEAADAITTLRTRLEESEREKREIVEAVDRLDAVVRDKFPDEYAKATAIKQRTEA